MAWQYMSVQYNAVRGSSAFTPFVGWQKWHLFCRNSCANRLQQLSFETGGVREPVELPANSGLPRKQPLKWMLQCRGKYVLYGKYIWLSWARVVFASSCTYVIHRWQVSVIWIISITVSTAAFSRVFFVSDVQPCPFCVYKFFDFPDHDTTIVTSSNTPYFDDCKTFPVAMTAELDKYLRAQVSCWFVLCPPVNLKFAF